MMIRPFNDSDASDAFRSLIKRIVAKIESLENEYVLRVSPTELEQFYIDEVVIEPLHLYTDQYYIENQAGAQVDVSDDYHRDFSRGDSGYIQGTHLDIAIPFDGDQQLWRLRPSPFTFWNYPEIDIKDGTIVFIHAFPDDTANSEVIRNAIDKQVQHLAEVVRNLHHAVENHNIEAQAAIRSALARKRGKALETTSVVQNLGIPMRRRDVPLTYVAPIQRRPSPVHRPAVPQGAYRPEPSLDEAEYEHILRVIRSMSLVIERSPQTFPTLDEEAIRTHFLIQLNGHYEGAATGETFNAAGKTDILIRVEDRNIFIAECKFWRGQKGMNEAIDQLLGYLSWRDTKCALVIFNRTRDSSAVRAKMHEIMISRPEHQKTVTHDPDGDSRYIFIKESDAGREIIITTLLFDIPTSAS